MQVGDGELGGEVDALLGREGVVVDEVVEGLLGEPGGGGGGDFAVDAPCVVAVRGELADLGELFVVVFNYFVVSDGLEGLGEIVDLLCAGDAADGAAYQSFYLGGFVRLAGLLEVGR